MSDILQDFRPLEKKTSFIEMQGYNIIVKLKYGIWSSYEVRLSSYNIIDIKTHRMYLHPFLI